MFEDENTLSSFRKTLKQVIKDLETISNCPAEDFQEMVLEKFDRYSYDGEDEVVGFDKWEDISQDGKYELEVGVNHEHAYVLTLFITVQDNLVTVTNVL